MRNRVYIASKLGLKEVEVARVKEELERRGYVITYDWTQNPVPKPFRDHPEEAHKAAEAMAEAVRVCDILIVLCAPDGLGMHIETGGALVTSIILTLITKEEHKRIFVVGDANERSVFYFHKSVARLSNVEELLDELPALI